MNKTDDDNKILKPIEITIMLGIAIDELYQHEVVNCGMEGVYWSEKEWKMNKFDELFETAIERVGLEREKK